MLDKEVTSELSSSICEGAGYDEIFLSGRHLKEDSPRSPKRELSTQSLSDENEGEDEGDVEDEYNEGEGDGAEGEDEEEGEEEGDEYKGEDDEGAPEGGSLRSLGDGRTRPFILPAIWTVNKFLPTMTTNSFKNLPDRYQIPKNVPIRLPRKFKRCYSRKTMDIGMYDTIFSVGLRLP